MSNRKNENLVSIKESENAVNKKWMDVKMQ